MANHIDPEHDHPALGPEPVAPRPDGALPLDYGRSMPAGYVQATKAIVAIAKGIGGFVSGVLALGILIAILMQYRAPISDGWVFFFMSLLVIPAAVALCFRGWRSLAVGYLIVVGFALLIFGLCAVDHTPWA